MFSFFHFVRFAFLLLKNTIRQVFVEHFLLLDPDPNAKAVCCVCLRNTQIFFSKFISNRRRHAVPYVWYENAAEADGHDVECDPHEVGHPQARLLLCQDKKKKRCLTGLWIRIIFLRIWIKLFSPCGAGSSSFFKRIQIQLQNFIKKITLWWVFWPVVE